MPAETCSQCGNTYNQCFKCGEKIIFVPRSGFGNSGDWRHLEPPKVDAGPHIPHPRLYIS